MNRSFFTFLLLPGLASTPAFSQQGNPPKNWIRPAQSLTGPAGYVTLPSSEVTDLKNLSLGVHRFGVGFLYSWPHNVEYGFSFDLREITTSSVDQTRQAFSPNAKIRLLNSPKWGKVAAGFYRKTYYGVYEREIVSPSLTAEGGGSLTNFAGVNTGRGFAALVYNTSLSRYMAEVDGRSLQPSVGWRYMLASWIAMDVALTNMRDYNNKFENFSFGLTLLSGSPSR